MSKSISPEEDLSSLNERLNRLEKKLDKKLRGQDDEVDIVELAGAIWKGKWFVFGVAVVFAVASVIFSLMLPNVYKSTALLTPSEEVQGGGLSALAGQFGGLASLAGIALPGGDGNKVMTSIEVIKSRQFMTRLIKKYDMLVPLMAARGWNRDNNRLIIDGSLYNEEKTEWIRDVSPPKTPEPSMWEAYKALNSILKVSRNETSGFITVEVEHYSPVIAQLWAEVTVREINEVMKDKDVNEAKKSIDFLSRQLEKTSVADMKSVFYQLIEEQTKTVMLADVRDEYVFTVIDPPVVAEEKAGPPRALICVLSTIAGGGLAVFILLVHFLICRNKN